MGAFELVGFPDDEHLARAAAAEWLKQLAIAVESAAPHLVALSGGRIAGRFFTAVSEQAKGLRLDWQRVDFFWGDERGVPPTDPESNYRLANERLLQPLGIPLHQVHRVRGEAPPEAAAAEAAAELGRVAPRDRDGQPVLDLVLLGMGEDGHIASLFPGEPEPAVSSPAIYRAVTGPKPPPRRITLGYRAIAAAREVWVLAAGAGKEAALRQSVAPGGRTPLARLLSLRSRTRILTDISLPGKSSAPLP